MREKEYDYKMTFDDFKLKINHLRSDKCKKYYKNLNRISRMLKGGRINKEEYNKLFISLTFDYCSELNNLSNFNFEDSLPF